MIEMILDIASGMGVKDLMSKCGMNRTSS